jgi:internalin A
MQTQAKVWPCPNAYERPAPGEKVRNCDVFVSLFFTKAGKYTEEEFDVAYGQFKSSKRPLLYTYFKNADVKIGDLLLDDLASLRKMMAKVKDLGHFHTEYASIEELKLHFRDQLPLIRDRLRI